MTEKRKLPRYKAKLPVTFNDNFQAEVKFTGTIMDLNLQGVGILTSTHYTKGKIINMNFDFKDGKKFYSIMGEIKYISSTPEGYHIGVEIINYNIYHLKKLVDTINSLAVSSDPVIS
ncbi:MAG: PilZ domain-containing protein [Elusimicrobia bacterium]|nr:PilZ domain-containing protein [Elusimicrobiota bacterium]